MARSSAPADKARTDPGSRSTINAVITLGSSVIHSRMMASPGSRHQMAVKYP